MYLFTDYVHNLVVILQIPTSGIAIKFCCQPPVWLYLQILSEEADGCIACVDYSDGLLTKCPKSSKFSSKFSIFFSGQDLSIIQVKSASP